MSDNKTNDTTYEQILKNVEARNKYGKFTLQSKDIKPYNITKMTGRQTNQDNEDQEEEQ